VLLIIVKHKFKSLAQSLIIELQIFLANEEIIDHLHFLTQNIMRLVFGKDLFLARKIYILNHTLYLN